jgi:hypothetical protein
MAKFIADQFAETPTLRAPAQPRRRTEGAKERQTEPTNQRTDIACAVTATDGWLRPDIYESVALREIWAAFGPLKKHVLLPRRS